jgi:hypothetical protein
MKKNKHDIIGVDFDDTLAVTKGTYPKIQGPVPEIVNYIIKRQKEGAYVILITMREGDVLDQAVEWAREQGIEFDAVNDNLPHMKDFYHNNPRKIFCNEYIDDKNIGGISAVLREIEKR